MNSFLYITDVENDRLPYNKELFFLNFEIFLDSFLILKDKKTCGVVTMYNKYRDTNDFRKNLQFPERLLKKLSKADRKICN